MMYFERRRGRNLGSPPGPPVSRRRPAWQPELAQPGHLRDLENPPPSPGGSGTKIQARGEEGGGFSRRSPVSCILHLAI